MIIFIDGADAVGKSTLAEKLAKWLKCDLIDLPLKQYYIDYSNSDDLTPITKIITTAFSKNVTDEEKIWFNALGLLHLSIKYKDTLAVAVRGIVSSYTWNGKKETKYLFDFLQEHNIGTGISIALDSSDNERLQRMTLRGKGEEEIKLKKVNSFNIKESVDYFKTKGLIIDYIDTTNKSADEVFEISKNFLESILTK